jgi:hypothetical protein
MPKQGTADHGLRHTLAQTGNALFVLGLATRPLSRNEVWFIEQRAMRKLRKGLQCKSSSQLY